MSPSPAGPATLDARPPSRRSAGKLRTRQRLYDAALELFSASGYDAVSVEDICQRAEVGRATFFRLYGTKSGLLVEFNRRLALDARAKVTGSQPTDAVEALRMVRQAVCDAWATSGALLHDMVREYLSTVTVLVGTTEAAPDLQALVADIIREGQRRGELVAEPGAEFVAWMVVSSLSSAVVTWVGSAATLERRSRATLDLLLGGLRADVVPRTE